MSELGKSLKIDIYMIKINLLFFFVNFIVVNMLIKVLDGFLKFFGLFNIFIWFF